MPYSSEAEFWHARQNDPKKYASLRHGELGKGIHVVYGIKSGGGSEIQAYLFPKDKFSRGQARTWLASHDVKDTINNEGHGMSRLERMIVKANLVKKGR